MWAVLLLSAVLVITGAVPSRDRNNKPYKVVCYHGTWSVYRPGAGKFGVDEIDPFLCTHQIYTFVGLGSDSKLRVLDGYLDLVENWGKGNMKKFVDLKNKNPNLTNILAIGGWNEGSTKYSEMARDAGRRKIFVDSAVAFLLKHDFDGLDMDWEYPANRGGIPQDKENFVALLRDLRTAFNEHGLLLTCAVSAGKPTIDTAYNIPEMAKVLDFVNLMTYDFHGGWEQVTGHNSPLYARPEESGSERNLNMAWAAQYWLDKGCPASKLVLGMGTYGRAFTLQNAQKNGLGATAPSAGRAGPYTREPGMLGYNEICEAQKRESGWTVVWNEHHMAPYAYKDNQWVGYDDEKSIGLKTEFAKSKGLAGAMIWSIETDDFRGNCGPKYPLLNKINSVLNGPVVRPPTPPPNPITQDPGKETVEPEQPTTTTRKPRPTPSPGTKECPAPGFYRFPDDCSRYYQCVEVGGRFDVIEFECGSGTVFDEKLGICAWPGSVPGC